MSALPFPRPAAAPTAAPLLAAAIAPDAPEAFDDVASLAIPPGLADIVTIEDIRFWRDVVVAQEELVTAQHRELVSRDVQQIVTRTPIAEHSAHFANQQSIRELESWCEGVEDAGGEVRFRPLRMNDEPTGRIVGIVAGVFRRAA